jgi:glycogen debranching enzyme
VILWYNALKILNELSEDTNKKNEYASLAKKVKESFVEKFWNDKDKCLYDVVHNDDKKDADIRPNQIFAVSLKFSILNKEKERAVFKKVQSELFTPFGLRSLSKKSGSYIGRYEGNQIERDRAYHQGTVWSWLIGPYVDAYLKVNGTGKPQIEEIELIMQPFYELVKDHGLGGISEIFDGNEPHRPQGCILQAWSVAEVLRIKKKLGRLEA